METSAPVRAIAADTRFSRLTVKTPKPKFNAVTCSRARFIFPKNRFHGHFGLGLGDSRLVDNFVYDIQLNQGVPQFGIKHRNPDKLMIVLGLFQCQERITIRYRKVGRRPGRWTDGDTN